MYRSRDLSGCVKVVAISNEFLLSEFARAYPVLYAPSHTPGAQYP